MFLNCINYTYTGSASIKGQDWL